MAIKNMANKKFLNGESCFVDCKKKKIGKENL